MVFRESNLNTQVQMPRTPRPIRIIGAGGIVKDAHLPAYRKVGLPVEGIFDIQQNKAKVLAKEFDISRVYGSMQELVTNSSTNFVYDIAVPASAILSVLKVLPDRSSVLIQKPLEENLKKAHLITQLCKDKQITAGINFQLRYAPAVVAARKMIDYGYLGDLHDLEIRLNVYTPWNRWDFLFDLPRVEILYHSIHYLDLIRSILGNPQGIYAKTVKHPKMEKLASTKSTIILDYGERIRATISTNHGHDFGPHHQESFVKLEGTKGALKITLGVNLNYPHGIEDRFEYCLLDKSENPAWQQFELSGSWFPDAFAGSMRSFQCYLEGTSDEFTSTLSDSVNTMALVEAAYLSSKKGGVDISP